MSSRSYPIRAAYRSVSHDLDECDVDKRRISSFASYLRACARMHSSSAGLSELADEIPSRDDCGPDAIPAIPLVAPLSVKESARRRHARRFVPGCGSCRANRAVRLQKDNNVVVGRQEYS